MKKILIVTQHFPPEIGAASNRIKQMVDHFQDYDIEIYVITSSPSYPSPRLYNKTMVSIANQNMNCKIFRAPAITLPLSDKVLRLLNQLIFLLFAIIYSTIITLRFSIKTCITSSPPFLINLIGVYCKVILRRIWIMEVRDLWPDSLVAVGAVKKESFLFRLLKNLELYFYSISDRIVMVTNRTKEIIVNQGINEEKIYIITNGISNWLLENKKITKKTNNVFNINYIGNIGLSQNLDIILNVAEILKSNDKICFNFIGEGLAKKNLMLKAKMHNLNNVKFIEGTTDKEILLEWYYKADLGIVSLNESSLFENVIPSKIFEYAACETNILFLGSGEAAELIEQYSLGISMKPDAKKIAEIVMELVVGNTTLNTDSEKRKEFIKRYSWENLIKKYIDVISFKE